MLTVTIVLCSWCKSPRPIEVHGVEKVKPGLHPAYVQVSHSICSICEVHVSEEFRKGGATSDDTSVKNNATEETKGC